jgi:hypothetical protein
MWEGSGDTSNAARDGNFGGLGRLASGVANRRPDVNPDLTDPHPGSVANRIGGKPKGRSWQHLPQEHRDHRAPT